MSKKTRESQMFVKLEALLDGTAPDRLSLQNPGLLRQAQGNNGQKWKPLLNHFPTLQGLISITFCLSYAFNQQ